jgi:predicted SprT family Zn-dependent metalloprotease
MKKLKLFDILLENKVYLDNEIVDFNEINIQNEFNKLNELLFNNELKPVRMEWSTRKTAHGHVTAHMNRLTKQITIKKLALSKFYNIPYKFFKDVLAHEMIHVKLLQQNLNVDHGPEFVAEMNKINAMGKGFNVTIKGDASNFEVAKSNSKSNVELVFLVLNLGDGNINVAVMNYNTYKNQGKNISSIFSSTCKSGKYQKVFGEFFLSKSILLQALTIQRSFERTISYQKVNDEKLEQFKAGARELSAFECTKEGCDWIGDDIPNEPKPKERKPKWNTSIWTAWAN